MDLTEFRNSTEQANPPEGMGFALRTLWWDAKGDWQRAHACAQQDRTQTGSSVHAYLHRKEGDMSNAAGWYNSAGRAQPAGTLEEEWEMLARQLLA
ncbi:MAG TPA: hypothetical protein VGG99_02900 [Acetobacteraceae bacterium]|jgi:hypothetical protein